MLLAIEKTQKFYTNTEKGKRKQELYQTLNFVQCDKCNTNYPIINNKIQCNGKIITKCLCEK
jgi:hypothetical protein